jgi:hypothetical protein
MLHLIFMYTEYWLFDWQMSVADLHSPVPKKPARSKRLRGEAEMENTPNGQTPKKQRGFRMRAGDSVTPKGPRSKTALADTAFADNVKPSPSGNEKVKHSEGKKTTYIDLSMRSRLHFLFYYFFLCLYISLPRNNTTVTRPCDRMTKGFIIHHEQRFHVTFLARQILHCFVSR